MRKGSRPRPRRPKGGGQLNALADAGAPVPPETLERLAPAFEFLRSLKLEMVGPYGREVLRRVYGDEGAQDLETVYRLGALLRQAQTTLGHLTLADVEGLAAAWLDEDDYRRGARPARRRPREVKRGGPRVIEAAIYLELAKHPACSKTDLAKRLGCSRRLLYLPPYREALAAAQRLAAEDRARRGRELLEKARRVCN